MSSAVQAEAHMDRTVLWSRLDEPWLERCTLARGTEGRWFWNTDGVVIGASNGVPIEVSYSVSCYEDWTTSGVSVQAFIGNQLSEVEMGREGGNWFVNGSESPELGDAIDVDLGFTPATNTLPIRRLGLEVGDSSEVQTAWVRFPELTVEPFPQRYTRAGGTTLSIREPDQRLQGRA